MKVKGTSGKNILIVNLSLTSGKIFRSYKIFIKNATCKQWFWKIFRESSMNILRLIQEL